MENSATQTATAIVPFVSFEDTYRAKFMALKSVEKKIKGHLTRAFKLDVKYDWVKSAKRFVFSPTGQSIDIADLYEEGKHRGDKQLTKDMNLYFGSQRISEARTYKRLVLSGEMEEVFNTSIRKMKSKDITSVGYLLKLYKKATAPEKVETAETPDVGETAESQAEPQEKVVSVPQTEEDFVALMIERGLDLDKVVEIIFDLDKSEKVA